MTRSSVMIRCLGCALLALMILRCGPIAPSLNKTTTGDSGRAGVLPPILELRFKSRLQIPVSVSRPAGLGAASSEALAVSLNEAQLTELKAIGSVALEILVESLPKTERAQIVIETGKNEIPAEAFAAIRLSLVQKTNALDTWTLSIKNDGSGDTAHGLREKITGLTIQFVNEPAAAAPPSPSPSTRSVRI